MISNILEELPNDNRPLEEAVGKCLTQPNSAINSASRKLMLSPQQEQRFALYNPEPPVLATGYENKFGELNSSLILAEKNYQIIAKISKFEDQPNHDYILVLMDENGNYSIHNRKHYKFNTESFGFLYNNDFIDSKNVGDIIYKNDTIRKSTAYDKYNNRQEGLNALTAYMSLGLNTDDGMIISENLAKKLDAPLIKKVQVMINDNNISLNLYGEDGDYQSFPNINYNIKDGILYASRLERKDECLFSQAVDRLNKTFVSDDKYIVLGKVVDIDIYCNDVEKLYSSYYNKQLLTYYLNSTRFSNEIVNVLKPLIDNYGDKCSSELKELYLLHYKKINNSKYIKDKAFKFCMLEFIVEERKKTSIGDKLADRFGGKGVIVSILPDYLMPKIETGEIVDVIIDSNSAVGRLNPGQLFEVSVNFIGKRLLESMRCGIIPIEEYHTYYLNFIKHVSPTQYEYYRDFLNMLTDYDLSLYMKDILEKDDIILCVLPLTESMDINKLEKLYDEFSWITPYKILSPIQGSNGNYRYIKTRRNLVVGKKYYYRLKQFAEDKHSVTTHSATNMKGLNSKSRSNKEYKSSYSNTPTTFGNMETANMCHMDPEIVVENLLLHSASPHARMLSRKIYDSADPFKVDIKIDSYTKNRNVEILNAYLACKGLSLNFYKRLKKLRNEILLNDIELTDDPRLIEAIVLNDENLMRNPISFDVETNKNIVQLFD